MTLKIARSPLDASQSQVILEHYNCLTSSRIPLREFLHWLQNGPEGPAWHAILEGEDGSIVGHSSVIPLRARFNGKRIVAGKSEYSFILEEYQSAKFRGFENVSGPRNAFMIQKLFEHCKERGIGPLLVSTVPASRRSLYSVRMTAVDIPVCECLLVLRPRRAIRNTPNIQQWQQVVLWLAGLFQAGAWSVASLFSGKPETSAVLPTARVAFRADPHHLSFFGDSDSLQWRFGDDGYEAAAVANSEGLLILKKGSPDRYLRVCQWQIDEKQPEFSLAAKLVNLAKRQDAVGVRWAVYGNESEAAKLVARLRKFGFLCALRTRRLLVYSDNQDFLYADRWKLTDAMFSFDP